MIIICPYKRYVVYTETDMLYISVILLCFIKKTITHALCPHVYNITGHFVHDSVTETFNLFSETCMLFIETLQIQRHVRSISACDAISSV